MSDDWLGLIEVYYMNTIESSSVFLCLITQHSPSFVFNTPRAIIDHVRSRRHLFYIFRNCWRRRFFCSSPEDMSPDFWRTRGVTPQSSSSQASSKIHCILQTLLADFNVEPRSSPALRSDGVHVYREEEEHGRSSRREILLRVQKKPLDQDPDQLGVSKDNDCVWQN